MIKKYFAPFLIVFISLIIYGHTLAQSKKTPYDYVNPFIGTDDMGHTYPGAAVPFGTAKSRNRFIILQ